MTIAAACARMTAHYDRVQRLRMKDVPLLNAALSIEAVGFIEGATRGVFEGVLITPWFMSLVRLPEVDVHVTMPTAAPQGDAATSDAATSASTRPLGVGHRIRRSFGSMQFDFLVAGGEPLGHHETCSLFSPMDAFANQAQARATALEALKLLRAPMAGSSAASSQRAPSSPSRRAFFGGPRTVPVLAGPR